MKKPTVPYFSDSCGMGFLDSGGTIFPPTHSKTSLREKPVWERVQVEPDKQMA